MNDDKSETGPTRRSTQEEAVVQSRTHKPPRSQWGHNLLRRVTTTTLSILILRKAYPTRVYLARYLDMQTFWLWRFILPKRTTNVASLLLSFSPA